MSDDPLIKRQGGQIPLDLKPLVDFSYDNFLTAPSNQNAFDMITAWPNWPAPVLLLLGPEGVGKTHLGQAWAAAADGVCVDDADKADETDLFSEINQALKGETSSLLLCSQKPPSLWNVQFKDLFSRLKNIPVITILEPDDEKPSPHIANIVRTLRARDYAGCA